MQADDEQEQKSSSPPPAPPREEGSASVQSFVDELGIEDLEDPIFGGRGRLFSAAGRESPVAEFTEDFLVLHPPQKPFEESGESPSEDIIIDVDDGGVLLDELGRQKNIPGARFRGHALFYLGERKPGTLKHYAGWFDKNDRPHLLYVNGEPITTDIVFKLRNKTHDGEISIFPDLESDDVENFVPEDNGQRADDGQPA